MTNQPHRARIVPASVPMVPAVHEVADLPKSHDRLDQLYPAGALDLPVALSVSAPRNLHTPREYANLDPLLYRDYYGTNILAELP